MTREQFLLLANTQIDELNSVLDVYGEKNLRKLLSESTLDTIYPIFFANGLFRIDQSMVEAFYQKSKDIECVDIYDEREKTALLRTKK
jgi:hypothetical protein